MSLKSTAVRAVLVLILMHAPSAFANQNGTDDSFFPSRDAYVHAFPEGPTREFAKSVWGGDVDQAIILAKTLPKGVNTVGNDGHTALEIATYRHNKSMMIALIKAGANPNGAPDRAPIALIGHDGQNQNFTEYADILIRAGANVDGLYGGWRAIDGACNDGDLDTIRTLINLHSDINQDPGNVGYPTLVQAMLGRWELVEYLLHHGASIWLSDAHGFTLGTFATAQLQPKESALIIESENTPEQATREKAALHRTIQFLRNAKFPWPAPAPAEVLKMQKDRKWPPASSVH